MLDLACGTGTVTWLLTGRGYEMIGADASEEMLAAAMMKSGSVEGIAPIFLHQSMPRLDLYGTVDAAICCLDSLNYLTSPPMCSGPFSGCICSSPRAGSLFSM
ncbi:MAG: methyltransferase domain-containing protein [Oscillospiraceae bacterium]